MTEDHEIAKKIGARIRDPAKAEREREREEFYKEFDEMGEAAVDRYVHLGEWKGDHTHMAWAQAWLREQQAGREDRALDAAETTARSTKATALLVAGATALAAGSLAWSVWGP